MWLLLLRIKLCRILLPMERVILLIWLFYVFSIVSNVFVCVCSYEMTSLKRPLYHLMQLHGL